MSASITATLSAPSAFTAAAAPADAPPAYAIQPMVEADVGSNIATAPETKTLLLNSKTRELAEARATLQALGNAVQLAQGAINFWTPQLLSANGHVRQDAAAKLFSQLMHVKRILPQMDEQEAKIAKLEKEIPALRLAIDTWPSKAGLVGGYAGPTPYRVGGYNHPTYQVRPFRQPQFF